MNCPALIYNKQMLAEAGCGVPGTWEEFYDTAVRTTGESHYGFDMAGIRSEESLYAFLPILWSMGGDVKNINLSLIHIFPQPGGNKAPAASLQGRTAGKESEGERASAPDTCRKTKDRNSP